MALESFVAENLSQAPPSPEVFKDLKQEWKAYQKLAKEATFEESSWSDRDEFFHESLAAALGNQQIYTALKDINTRLHFLRVKDITTAKVLTASARHHLAIIDAIQKGDTDRAVKLVRSNVQMGKDNVKIALQRVLMRALEART